MLQIFLEVKYTHTFIHEKKSSSPTFWVSNLDVKNLKNRKTCSCIAIFLQFCLCASRQYFVGFPALLRPVLILKLNDVRKQIPAAFK